MVHFAVCQSVQGSRLQELRGASSLPYEVGTLFSESNGAKDRVDHKRHFAEALRLFMHLINKGFLVEPPASERGHDPGQFVERTIS